MAMFFYHCTQRKKYWRSAGFRRTKSSRNPKRSECFFNTANLQKIAELKSMSGLFFLLFNFVLHPAFCKFILQVALLKFTKTFIKTMLYNMKKHIVSALNFNILKTNLSKIASKEVEILFF